MTHRGWSSRGDGGKNKQSRTKSLVIRRLYLTLTENDCVPARNLAWADRLQGCPDSARLSGLLQRAAPSGVSARRRSRGGHRRTTVLFETASPSLFNKMPAEHFRRKFDRNRQQHTNRDWRYETPEPSVRQQGLDRYSISDQSCARCPEHKNDSQIPKEATTFSLCFLPAITSNVIIFSHFYATINNEFEV